MLLRHTFGGEKIGSVKISMKTEEAKYETTEDTEECGGKPSFLMRFFNKILCVLMV